MKKIIVPFPPPLFDDAKCIFLLSWKMWSGGMKFHWRTDAAERKWWMIMCEICIHPRADNTHKHTHTRLPHSSFSYFSLYIHGSWRGSWDWEVLEVPCISSKVASRQRKRLSPAQSTHTLADFTLAGTKFGVYKLDFIQVRADPPPPPTYFKQNSHTHTHLSTHLQSTSRTYHFSCRYPPHTCPINLPYPPATHVLNTLPVDLSSIHLITKLPRTPFAGLPQTSLPTHPPTPPATTRLHTNILEGSQGAGVFH